MKQFLFAAALLLAPLSAHAQDMTPISEMPAGVYQVDKTHASLIWKLNHMGLSNYTARFNTFDATIDFHPEDVTASKVKATISPFALETDFPNPDQKDFDKELATGDSWLNGGEYPKIEFASTELVKTGENTGTMTGNLTMLGRTNPVTMDVTFNGAYAEKPLSSIPAMGFSAEGTLKRSDWGMTNGIPMVGDEITFMIEAEFEQPQAPEAE